MSNLQQISDEIEIMRTEMRMPKFEPPKDIDSIINAINMNTLAQYDSLILDEFSIKLAAYALYVKHEINRLKAKANYCEANIKKIIGLKMRNIDGYFDEKQSFIRANDTQASELQDIKDATYAKLNILEDLDLRIQFLCQTLGNYAKGKRYRKWEN